VFPSGKKIAKKDRPQWQKIAKKVRPQWQIWNISEFTSIKYNEKFRRGKKIVFVVIIRKNI